MYTKKKKIFVSKIKCHVTPFLFCVVTYNCEPLLRMRLSSSTVNTGLPLSGLGDSSLLISSGGCGTRNDGLREPGKAIWWPKVTSPVERCVAWAAACKTPGAKTSYADFLRH